MSNILCSGPVGDAARCLGLFLSGAMEVRGDAGAADSACPDTFRPFLTVRRRDAGRPDASACLLMRFGVRRASFMQRVVVPYCSIPFFSGRPGFLSKTYGIDERTASFCGVYTWQDAQSAEAYMQSYAGRFMRRNAVAGTVRYDIRPLHRGATA